MLIGLSPCANGSADASAAATMEASVAVSIEMLTRIFEGAGGAMVSKRAPW